MLVETIVSLFLVVVIGVFMLFIKKSNEVPEQHEIDDSVFENKDRKPHILITLIIFYPVYYLLHDILKVQITTIDLGVISFGVVVAIVFFIASIIKYKNIDKFGYADKNDYKYDLISIVCAEILFMLYLLT